MKPLICAALVAIAVWALVQAPAPPRSLADYAPSGPLLFLEAKDFGSLLRAWNASSEKNLWLRSDNFSVFSRSRLYLRLNEAHAEFASAAGFPAGMPLLESVAGAESALALYDIGSLHFLYITKLPSARTLETVLWRFRTSYESRSAAGSPYFVRIDPASRRVTAFAMKDDYLLLATREDLIAGALALLAGQPGSAAKSEQWFAEAVRAAGPPGDLRLVMNLPALVRSPHFRSYWIQRNVSEVRQYTAGIADVHRSAAEIREDRVFLRQGEAAANPPNAEALAQALRLVPERAGLYRTWLNPGVEDTLALLRNILDPQPATPVESRFAPFVSAAAAGTEEDLETRIDEPPVPAVRERFATGPLKALLESARLEAMLEVGSTRLLPGGAFVAIDSAVVLLAASDWDSAAVAKATAPAAESGPLGRLASEARGRLLVVANSSELMKNVLARMPAAAGAQSATYAAGFDHAGERPNFRRLTGLIDHAVAPESREPRFFSQNIGSLGQALARIESSSIAVRDTGPAVFATVRYRLGK